MTPENEYPRMLYAEDGRTQTVTSQDEENGLDGEWAREPFDAHRNPANPGATKVEASGNEALADMIADRVVARLRGDSAGGTVATDPDAEAPGRRGPGRPRNS